MKPTRKEALTLGLGALSTAWAATRSDHEPLGALLGLEPPDDMVYAAALTRARSRVAVALRGRVDLWATARLGVSARTLFTGAADQLLVTPDDSRLIVAGPDHLAVVRVTDGATLMARTLQRPVQLLGVSPDGAVVHCRERVDGPPLITQRRLDDGSTRAGVYLQETTWRIYGVHKISDARQARCLVEDDAGRYLATADLETGEVGGFAPLDSVHRLAVATALESRGTAMALTPDGGRVVELRGGALRFGGESRPWRRAEVCGPGPLFKVAFNADGSGAVAWGRGAAVFVADPPARKLDSDPASGYHRSR